MEILVLSCLLIAWSIVGVYVYEDLDLIFMGKLNFITSTIVCGPLVWTIALYVQVKLAKCHLP